MTSITSSAYRCMPSPLHAIFLAGAIPLFLGALLSDIAYFRTFQIQWSNFASWLIAGGLVFFGFTLLFALANLFQAKHKGGRPLVYLLLVSASWVLGLINAFEHAKDAFAIMPTGLVLSVIVTLLVIVTAWVGLTNLRSGDVK